MNNQKFFNGHVHSQFSTGDGLASPEDLVKQTKSLGMDSLCLTEHGTLASHFQLKQACDKHKIKPVFGLEAYFVDDVNEVFTVTEQIDEIKSRLKTIKKDKRFTKETKEKEELLNELISKRNILKKYNHLILLAKTKDGYNNLVKIHNDSVIDGIYYKPRISWNVLEKHKGGLISSSACIGGRLSRLILANDIDAAINAANRFEKIFGKGNFYLELQLNHEQMQKDINIGLIKIHELTGLPLTLTTDVHYLTEKDSTTRELIRQLDKEEAELNNDDSFTDLYIKNDDMLYDSWNKYMPDVDKKYLQMAIDNSRIISDSIEVFDFDTSIKFPAFETGNLSQEDFLVKNAWEGLKKRGLSGKPEYQERLKKEINTINKLGFAGYFNVVSDMTIHAKMHQPVGVGRGCVIAGTPVYMSNNTIKNIEDIIVGDEIISHDGSKQLVIKTHEYEINEDLLEIQVWNGNSITLTKDHKIWSAFGKVISNHPKKKKYFNINDDLSEIQFDWNESQNLKKGDLVWIPKIQRNNIINKYSIDLSKFYNFKQDEIYIYEENFSNKKGSNSTIKGFAKKNNMSPNTITKYLNNSVKTKESTKLKLQNFKLENKIKTILPKSIIIDEEFCYWLGRFTGDGWLVKSSKKVVGMAFNSNDNKGISLYIKFLNSFKLNYNIQNHKTKSLTQIIVNSKLWENIFKELFPLYNYDSKTKHVPDFIFQCNENYILKFLQGYSDADGNIKKNKTKYTTVSHMLAENIEYLYKILGLPTLKNIVYRDYPHLNLKNQLSISIYGNNPYDINKIYQGKYFKEGTTFRIKNINIIKNISKVYDITTTENHSYLSNFAIHNSAGGSLLAYCLDITEVDPLEYGLFFERFLDLEKCVGNANFGLEKQLKNIDLDVNKIVNCACNKKH